MTEQEQLVRVRQLLKDLQAEERKHQENDKLFMSGDADREPHHGDYHASLHRARFIRELFYALEGHMP